MDVFISEEYVLRRRMEKKAFASIARKKSKICSSSSTRPENGNKIPRLPDFQLENEFRVTDDVHENFVLDFCSA